jgi:hypothetical protein
MIVQNAVMRKKLSLNVSFFLIFACSFSLISTESLTPLLSKTSKLAVSVPEFRIRGVGGRFLSLRGGNSTGSQECVNHQESLLNAVKENNHGNVEKSIMLGADPNFQDANGMSALHYAATEGNLHLFKILTGHGGIFRTQSQDGSTSLHLAAYYGHSDIVKYMLEEGRDDNAIDANVKDLDGSTPLHNAAYRGQCACAAELLNHGADVNVCQVTSMPWREHHRSLIDSLLLYEDRATYSPHLVPIRHIFHLNDSIFRPSMDSVLYTLPLSLDI